MDNYVERDKARLSEAVLKQAVKDLSHKSKKIRSAAATWLLKIGFDPVKITDKTLQEWIFNNL